MRDFGLLFCWVKKRAEGRAALVRCTFNPKHQTLTLM
jgi:hypothetical protein